MKAILVIDVDENADLENAIADITIRLDEWGVMPRGVKHWYSGLKAKPLPQRKEFDNQIPYEKSGWNDCLDEILGGE